MVCKKCNKRIKNDTPVCPYCGAPQTETVSLSQMNAAQEEGKKKKLTGKQKAKRAIIIIVSILAALALLIAGGCFAMEHWYNSTVEPEELNEEELGINEELPATGVTNIALFGLDDRADTDDGRSDAIIVLSIDRDHNKIKMTSIARDTLVNVENYGWNNDSRDDDWTKITHAFAYGGAASAVKALNENFNLNISKYAYVNFHEFAEIIDYLGGVDIEVQEREISQMNKHIRGMVSKSNMDIQEVTSAGMQTLSGGQALAYARLRKIDSDVVRGNRQKAVLEAAFQKVKTQPLTKFPELITKVLGICNTNMTMRECLELATWAVSNSPEIVNYSLPDENASLYAKGGTVGSWGWVYIFDLDYTTALLHDFIYETETADEETAERLTSPRFPAHMQAATSSEQ